MSSNSRRVVLFCAPVILGAVNLTHPAMAPPVYEKIVHHMPWWLALHLIDLPAFALFGIAAYLLVKDQQGSAARFCKLAIAIYVPIYAAFDALAGIGTGIIVGNPQSLTGDRLAAASSLADLLFGGPVTAALAAAGSIAWVISMFAAAIAFTAQEFRKRMTMVAIGLFLVGGWARNNLFLRADGVTINTTWWLTIIAMAAIMFAVARPRIPATLLVLAGALFGAAHTPPTGPMGALCFLGAGLYLEFAARKQEEIRSKAAAI